MGHIQIRISFLIHECTGRISYIQFEKLTFNLRAILMEDLANTAIEAALKAGATFADVRIENTSTTIIEVSDGVSKQYGITLERSRNPSFH